MTAATMRQKGKLQFTDVTVDPTTGAVRLRAIFPNPDGLLLPGMYVRATVIEGVDPHGILAPQQGVSHDAKGEPTALVVDDQGMRAAACPEDRPRRGRRLAGAGRPQARRQDDRGGPAEGPARHASHAHARPNRQAIGHRYGAFRAFSSTGRSSPGLWPSSSCWRARIAAFSLPIAQYPTIAPPAVVVSTFYPGADAETLQNSVTQVIEQQLTGLDNLLYFSSASNADGSVSITATFAAGTNPDIAQVQVQNKVQQAIPQLPAQVQQQGIAVQSRCPTSS